MNIKSEREFGKMPKLPPQLYTVSVCDYVTENISWEGNRLALIRESGYLSAQRHLPVWRGIPIGLHL
jgi:hypothetical protein